MFDKAQLDFKIMGTLIHKDDNHIILSISNHDIDIINQQFQPLPVLDFIRYRKKRSLDCPLPNLDIDTKTHAILVSMTVYADISTGITAGMLNQPMVMSGYLTKNNRWVVTGYQLYRAVEQPN